MRKFIFALWKVWPRLWCIRLQEIEIWHTQKTIDKIKGILDRSEHCMSYVVSSHGHLHPFGTSNVGFQEISTCMHVFSPSPSAFERCKLIQDKRFVCQIMLQSVLLYKFPVAEPAGEKTDHFLGQNFLGVTDTLWQRVEMQCVIVLWIVEKKNVIEDSPNIIFWDSQRIHGSLWV